MNTSARDTAKHTNRLIHESSPYLLQHAHNPVDWYAWGPEAFETARRENKPIFLSVGYSTCYWCHVMERQSFENEAVAAEMNRLFVNIKVDREERPDVDQLYMTAVQVQTRQGGWPMSVFLTPERRYFYGGTYFPPTDAYGRPGFVTLIRALADAYHNRRQDVEETAGQFLEILRRSAQPPAPRKRITIDQSLIERLIEQSISDYDSRFGGFGSAPKFPRETLLELLLVYLAQAGDSSELPVSGLKAQFSNLRSQISLKLRHTLDAMADGGIRDQLGGGFHRYSTDAQWLVPHFEIMLYDNAMLGWCYAQASAQFHEPRYAEIARGIFDFVLREMTSPAGAFYTAFDAEVDAQEGLSYLWTRDEIERILGLQDAKLFNLVYGVDRGPNFADPHHGTGTPDKSILFLPQPLAAAAKEAKMDVASLESRLEPMRLKLYQARQQRKQPLLDTKIITSWNALMIRAMAHGGKVLSEPRYLEASSRAADFLLAHHRREDGGLYRTSRDGKAKYDAFLDDYSFFIQALLILHEATGEKRWQEEANALAAAMRDRFGDAGGGFFYTDRSAVDLAVRQKTATDSPLPSGNAVAAMVLTELGQADEACQTISLFSEQMQQFGEGMSAMVEAALLNVSRHGPLDVQPGTPGGEHSSVTQEAREVVSVETQWQSDQELLVRLNIREGFHINSNTSADRSNASFGPTRLAVEGEPDAQLIYPAPSRKQFAFSDQPLDVYEGSIEILVRFPRSRRGGLPVRLVLSYQPCTEQACLPPMSQRVDVES